MFMLEHQSAEILGAEDEIDGHLAGAKLGLFVGAVDITQARVLADFTAAKATYTGYVKQAITWLEESVADDGTVEVVGTVPQFRPTDAVAPNMIAGCWIEDAAASDWYYAGYFDNQPLPMNGILDAMLVTVRYRPRSGTFAVVVS